MNGRDDYLHRLLFLPKQASTFAPQIDWLHYLVIGSTLLGAGAVTLVAAIFCIKYRARRTRPASESSTPAPNPPLWAEWTAILSLFGLFLAFWVIGFGQYVRMSAPPPDTFDVYVTAKQWMWKFDYPDGRRSIAQLYVPAGVPVRLIMTSRDVIHSFYVPAFRAKQDVIPGRSTSLWFNARYPGTQPILCAEYCGGDHSLMRGEVIALSATDFARWLERGVGDAESAAAGDAAGLNTMQRLAPEAPPEPLTMLQRGQLVAGDRGCLRCHTLDGSPHIGPTWLGLYGSTIPLERGGDAVADAAYLTESMMDPMAQIHRGFQPVMPSYFGLLQPAEVGALLELMKSLAGPSAAGNPPNAGAQEP
jgi:cytochrome c oxidase subunit 2